MINNAAISVARAYKTIVLNAATNPANDNAQSMQKRFQFVY
jgi:hypothetical protein